MDKTEMQKRIESEQRAIVRISNDNIVCKDCRFRLDDSETFGNTSSCDKYPEHTKPFSIILKGENCEYYEKEK